MGGQLQYGSRKDAVLEEINPGSQNQSNRCRGAWHLPANPRSLNGVAKGIVWEATGLAGRRACRRGRRPARDPQPPRFLCSSCTTTSGPRGNPPYCWSSTCCTVVQHVIEQDGGFPKPQGELILVEARSAFTLFLGLCQHWPGLGRVLVECQHAGVPAWSDRFLRRRPLSHRGSRQRRTGPWPQPLR